MEGESFERSYAVRGSCVPTARKVAVLNQAGLRNDAALSRRSDGRGRTRNAPGQ